MSLLLANCAADVVCCCRFALRKEDLVLAVPSDLKHQVLIESSKAWRKVRTSVAVAQSVHSIPCLRRMKWEHMADFICH